MGRSRRNKPKKLSQKLLAIRKRLNMSQTEMAGITSLRKFLHFLTLRIS